MTKCPRAGCGAILVNDGGCPRHGDVLERPAEPAPARKAPRKGGKG